MSTTRSRLFVGLILASTLAAPIEAQRLAPSAVTSSHRSPVLAGVLGYFPGLGHVYAGEPKRGLAVFCVFMFGAYFAMTDGMSRSASTGGQVVMAGSWLFSIVDAVYAAKRYNRRY